MENNPSNAGRRNFLKHAATAGAGALTACSQQSGSKVQPVSTIPNDQGTVNPADMPMTRIKHMAVSRLVMGANPMWGWSHRGDLLTQLMLDYYTTEQVVEVLLHAERCGINTWQTSLNSRHEGQAHAGERVMHDWQVYKDAGGKMNLIALITPANIEDETIWRKTLAMKPDALVHHGNMADKHWANRDMEPVKERLKIFRDAGTLVGYSCHTPNSMLWVEEQGWDVDFYMSSFYRASYELRKQWPETLEHKPLHEMYLEGIPDEMTAAMRKVEKPALGYKVLAAGRLADKPDLIGNAFKYAFDNIKQEDGVIVGMFPKFRDQVTESARLTVQYGQV